MAYDLVRGMIGRNWSAGSMLLPKAQERALLHKVDDVRYDIRRTRFTLGAGMYAVSAAIAALAISQIYRKG
jgi:hypothetical protein